MKSKNQKRHEAIIRINNYSYNNSKAKRKGISQASWEVAKDAHLNHLITIK